MHWRVNRVREAVEGVTAIRLTGIEGRLLALKLPVVGRGLVHRVVVVLRWRHVWSSEHSLLIVYHPTSTVWPHWRRAMRGLHWHPPERPRCRIAPA